MNNVQSEGKIKRSLLFLRQHRLLSAFLSIFLVVFSILTLSILNMIITVNSFPNFALENFRVMKVENHTVYTDLSFTLFEQLDFTVRVNQITCRIQSGSSDGQPNQELATGSTIESLVVLKGSVRIENLSFVFDVPDIESLLTVLISDEDFIVRGQIFLEWGLSTPYKIQLSGIETEFFPSISILEIHPIYPGSVLEVLVQTQNYQGITLNITTASFQLTSPDYGSLGTAYFENVSIPPGRTSVTLSLHSNTSELTWLTERILNNGTIKAKIGNFQGEFLFAGERINVSVQEGPQFFWEDFAPSLDVLGVSNINLIEGYFDVNIGFQGQPLWGYNLTCITFEFYQLLNETHGPEIVGTGNFSDVILVPRLSTAQVDIRINIIPEKIPAMFAVFFQTGEFTLDIQNGIICLQFFTVNFDVSFTFTI